MKRFAYKNRKNKNYFEGWYFRFVGDVSIGVIFAITKNENDPHAFIQLFSSGSTECEYLRFSNDEFRYDYKNDVVYIGENSLSNHEVKVNNIHLKMSNHHEFSEQSAMTYLENAPLECFQEVLYMSANASGSINGEVVTGTAYSEKTYGTNFPSKWIWLQSFASEKGSLLSFSVGMVPVLFFKVKGFFILLETTVGKFRMSSTNLSKINVSEKIVIKKAGVVITLTPKLKHTVKLVGPSKNGLMNLDVFESLNSVIELTISKKGKVIFEDRFIDVGMELMFH